MITGGGERAQTLFIRRKRLAGKQRGEKGSSPTNHSSKRCKEEKA